MVWDVTVVLKCLVDITGHLAHTGTSMNQSQPTALCVKNQYEPVPACCSVFRTSMNPLPACVLQLVMSSLQSILENLDTPELLCQSVRCILQVARCYPHVFSTNFRVSEAPVAPPAGPVAILSWKWRPLVELGGIAFSI